MTTDNRKRWKRRAIFYIWLFENAPSDVVVSVWGGHGDSDPFVVTFIDGSRVRYLDLDDIPIEKRPLIMSIDFPD